MQPVKQTYDMKYLEQHGHLQPTGVPLTGLGAGDSFVLFNVCPPATAATAFERMRDEVPWNTMMHHGGPVPRLISIQVVLIQKVFFYPHRRTTDETIACTVSLCPNFLFAHDDGFVDRLYCALLLFLLCIVSPPSLAFLSFFLFSFVVFFFFLNEP